MRYVVLAAQSYQETGEGKSQRNFSGIEDYRSSWKNPNTQNWCYHEMVPGMQHLLHHAYNVGHAEPQGVLYTIKQSAVGVTAVTAGYNANGVVDGVHPK